MLKVTRYGLIVLGLVFLLPLYSCSDDPAAPKDNDTPPSLFKSLQVRDDVLYNLEVAYTTRQINEIDRLLDDNFTFFFSPWDVTEGTVAYSQWDRAAEMGATTNMFDPSFSPAYLDPVDDIDLMITFPEGDAAWDVIPGTEENGHPDEDWYAKTMTYLLNVRAGEVTFTSGTPLDAKIVVRQVEMDGKHIYRIVEWRDDI